jgi:predicted ATPase
LEERREGVEGAARVCSELDVAGGVGLGRVVLAHGVVQTARTQRLWRNTGRV